MISFCSIGDVHGQYYDFLHLLSLTGKPSTSHTLVFNGDLVDRGSWSTEILLTVLAYKCTSSAIVKGQTQPLTGGTGGLCRAVPEERLCEPRQPRDDGHEPCLWLRGVSLRSAYRSLKRPLTRHLLQGEANKKYGAQAYKLSEEVFTARKSLSQATLCRRPFLTLHREHQQFPWRP